MNVGEVEQLLQLIESYDRTPFKPGAIELWAEVMQTVVFQDAVNAVHQIFRVAGHDARGDIRRLLPADVKRPAEAIGDARRRRTAQAAVEARKERLGSTGRPAAVERMLAEARAKAAAAAEKYHPAVVA